MSRGAELLPEGLTEPFIKVRMESEKQYVVVQCGAFRIRIQIASDQHGHGGYSTVITVQWCATITKYG